MSRSPYKLYPESTTINWAFTLIFGSALAAYLVCLLAGEASAYEEIVKLAFGLYVGSLLFSLPALFGMRALAGKLNKRRLDVRAYRKAHNVYHLVIAAASFLVAALLLPVSLGIDPLRPHVLLGVPLGYTVTGLLIWDFSFYRAIRRIQQLPHA